MKNILVISLLVLVFHFGFGSPALASEIQPSLTGKKFLYIEWDYRLMKEKNQFAVAVTGTKKFFPGESSQEWRNLDNKMIQLSKASLVELNGSFEVVMNYPKGQNPEKVTLGVLKTLGEYFQAETVQGFDSEADLTVRGIWETNSSLAIPGAMLVAPLALTGIPSNLSRPVIRYEPGRGSIRISLQKTYEVKKSSRGVTQWFLNGKILKTAPREWKYYEKHLIDLPDEIKKYF